MINPKRYGMAEAQLSWNQQALKNCIAKRLNPNIASLNQGALSLSDVKKMVPAITELDDPIANYPAFLERGFCENVSLPPAIIASPDKRFLAIQCIDESEVSDCPIMQSVPLDHSVRPIDRSYKAALPGDKCLPMATLLIADANSNNFVSCDRPPIPASNGGLIEAKRAFWGTDNLLYIIEQPRDRSSITLVQVNPVSGVGRELLTEYGDTYLQAGPLPFSEPLVRILPDSNAFIWYSQKSGWGHLYLHDLDSGALINTITTGQLVVTAIHAVDESSNTIYYSACGDALNPYYEQMYRVGIDGENRVLLTPESAQHDIESIDIIAKTCIDCFSCVDSPTQIVIRSLIDGSVKETLLHSEEACKAADNFNHPVSFSAKADDKLTDLYGVMYRPSDFDDTQSYPVILAIYGTPHECVVPKRYAQTSDIVRDIYRSLAELGFIVVIVDPRGTPLRGKAFHDVAYKNLQNGGGIDDQVAVLKQLGQRHSWMDMERVGITGHSGGGYASARAMMTHADFFKVCVSSAGNHDQRLYVAGWAEAFQGLVAGDNYDVFNNDHLIDDLKGKLLLVHGDIDANVHIAHTMQLVDKLMIHNKDFDLLILPNRGHLHTQDTYFIRRLWDYFVENLLGDIPPKEYVITPPQ